MQWRPFNNMKTKSSFRAALLSIAVTGSASVLLCQTLSSQERPGSEPPSAPRGAPPQAGQGRGGFGRGGPGGFGGGPQTTELIPQFDKDGDKRLNTAERKAAREFLQSRRGGGRGPGGRGGGGGGPMNFGPGMMLAPQIITQADKDGNQKLSREEFVALAETWFDKLDPEKAGKLNQEQFVERFGNILPPPPGSGGRRGDARGEGRRPGAPGDAPDARRPDSPAPGQTPQSGQTPPQGFGRGGRGGAGFGPAGFVAPGLFSSADADKDASLTRAELRATFEKWYSDWDAAKNGAIEEGALRDGLNASLPQPNFGGGGGRGGGFPGFGGRGGNQPPPQPGRKLTPSDVKAYADAPLYDAKTLRTFFLEFEDSDWERELADFYHTDVEVPAKLTVDGKTYSDVGVHFRGTSSYMMAGEGRKRSLNLSMDYVHDAQNLYGYRTLNLLNSQADPTFLRTVLYNHIARQFIAAPKVNFVRVVINGESWGVFVNSQQFNKEFMKEFFGTTKTARWKMPGNQRGTGRFNYLGEDVAEYKRVYDIKSKDDPKAWADLMKLCQTLDQTPPEKLEDAITPLLDVDAILKFLALDNVLINSDGYWVRTGDFNVCQDDKGRFHIVPHDANETFGPPNGPGFGQVGFGGAGGGAGGNGGPSNTSVELDPLWGTEDPEKPLLHKLLAVPALRERYLGYVRAIAEEWLDWKKLGPIVAEYQALIAEEVQLDTRKLYATEAFSKGITEDVTEGSGFRGGNRFMGLKNFADKRRAYLLNYLQAKRASNN